MDHKITHQDIINYYDDCEGDYRLLWHLNEQSAMHYGYWKEDTKLLRDALKNMNDYVFSVLNLNSGERYLCLLYTSPSPRDRTRSRMPSSA